MGKEKVVISIGTIDIPSITFDMDRIPVIFDITEISDDAMKKIKEAVEVEKHLYCMNHLKAESSGWGQSGIEICFTYLSAVISTTEDSKYCIIAGFKDLENNSLESEICINVDLMEYDRTLKEIIIQAIASRFIIQC